MLESNSNVRDELRLHLCCDDDEGTDQVEQASKERQIKGCRRKVIVDDVLVYGRDAEPLLQYFLAVLNVIKHHRDKIKPNN